MFYHFASCLLIIAVCISYYVLKEDKTEIFPEGIPTVVIGILSARENFQQRQSIRNTWLNPESISRLGIDPNTIISRFIIGNQSCGILPQCRRDKYGCEKLTVKPSDVRDAFYTSVCQDSEHCAGKEKIFHQGFSFQVNHPVVVTKLGIYAQLVPHEGDVNVSLRDLQTKQVVVDTTISATHFKATHEGYIYEDVENILLPKGYQGLLLVEGHLLQSYCSDVCWNSNGGIITFERIFPSSDVVESFAFSHEFGSPAAIGLTVLEMDDVNKTATLCSTASSDLEQYMIKVNEQLDVEQKKWGDIVFVNRVDTYRSLPRKLLDFYDWLMVNSHFNYFLKTDDDCIIDISKIMLRLNETGKFDPSKLWIWSRFRSNWPVNYVGKWADYEYRSPVYPSFPCGGAYVLSRETVLWLQKNKNYLHPYQGEDVSIGIWLTAINPLYIEDEGWECDNLCTINSYNRVQLLPQDIVNVWSIRENCGNVCTC